MMIEFVSTILYNTNCYISTLLQIHCNNIKCYNPNSIGSYKIVQNYLQNTQHVVLRNRPTLSMGTERLACLNNPVACSWGPSPSTRQVLGSSPGPGGRAACAFFLHPPFFPPSGDSFFSHLPTQPTVRLGLNNTTGWVHHNPNSIESYKIVQKLSPKHAARVLRNRPTLSMGTERLACLNNPRGVQLGTLA